MTGRPPHAALHLAALHDSKSRAAVPAGAKQDTAKQDMEACRSSQSTTGTARADGAALRGDRVSQRDVVYGRSLGSVGGMRSPAAADTLLQHFQRAQKEGSRRYCAEACLDDEVPLVLTRCGG